MSKLNLQNLPKKKAFLQCFVADAGNNLVAIDFRALEPMVLAYYSQDPNLMRLYGPQAHPSQDVYLYNATLMGELGKKILASGYDPLAPTVESVAKAKKDCKQDRSISKTITLAANYGAGPKRLHETLTSQGIDVTFSEVQGYHRTFWKSYSGIKLFETRLLRRYEKTGGWILNGRGRPLTIDENKLKDILNRFIQSSGHDLLLWFVWKVTEKLDKAGLKWRPYLIDYHDEMIVQAPDDGTDRRVVELMQETMDDLNAELQWNVKLGGTPKIGKNLAEIKLED